MLTGSSSRVRPEQTDDRRRGSPAARRKDRLHGTRRIRRPPVWVVVLALLLTAGCERPAEPPSSPAPLASGDSRTVSGAGATFPAPIYECWFKRFPETFDGAGVDVGYEAVGSGKGIAAFTERRVDFGATDIPLNPEELAKAEAAGGAVIHIPTVLGAITVVYNLPAPRGCAWTPS
jgi:phosphate transport system substrate-binding protein